MKTIKKPLLWGGLVGLLLSCSNIAEEDRLIYVEPATANRAVLIEDFTGQRCVNCPRATEKIHEIQELYGEDAVIAVAIHCGPFGFTGNKKYAGLKTDFTQQYWDAWFDNSQGQPVAKINRGAGNDDYQNWSSVIATELQKTTNVTINILCNYDEATRKITVNTSVVGPNGEKDKLQLWLVEDGIVGMQSQPDGSIMEDYVHNHILREAINGTWGEEFTYSESANEFKNDITLNDKYVADNCSVVAFVYNDTEGVKQVVKTPVHKN